MTSKKTETPTTSKSVGRVTAAEGRSKVVYSKDMTTSSSSNAGKAAAGSPVGRTRWDAK